MPDEVIGEPLMLKPVGTVIATLVTVPAGSSPDGITTHSVEVATIVSPALQTGAVEWSDITLYVNPTLDAADGKLAHSIVPPSPTVPLKTIGPEIPLIASYTALDVGTLLSVEDELMLVSTPL